MCPGETFNLAVKKNTRNDQKKSWWIRIEHLPPHRSIWAIFFCRKGAIFIRASYGTSHGQNNISAAVTSRWRQDESTIKIKENEYKWCLLHLEGEINHRWLMSCILSPPLFAAILVISHRHSLILCLHFFFFWLSFPDSLLLIKLPAKCPFVLINHPGSKNVTVFVSRCQVVRVEGCSGFCLLSSQKEHRVWYLNFIFSFCCLFCSLVWFP